MDNLRLLIYHISIFLELIETKEKEHDDKSLMELIEKIPLEDLYYSDFFWQKLRVRILALQNEVYKHPETFPELIPVPTRLD